MPYNGKKIGLGVITWERPEFLTKFFKTLEKTDLSIFDKVVIIDDASKSPEKNALLEKARQVVGDQKWLVLEDINGRNLSNVDIVQNKSNVGVAGNSNRVIKYMKSAGMDVFFIANDDLYFKESWAADYLDVITKTRYKHMTFVHTSTPASSTVVEMNGLKFLVLGKPFGTFMSTTRNVTEAIGGFDESFGKFGFEHYDYSDRILRAGLTKGYADILDSRKKLGINTDWSRSTTSADEKVDLYKKVNELSQNRNVFRLYRPIAGESSEVDISVIVPTMNRPETLILALTSATKQKFDGTFEVVVVDDGGEDLTSIIDSKFSGDLREKIRYFPLAHNVGRGAIRNYAIYVSRGKKLFFLDDDDMIAPNGLQKLYDASKNKEKCVTVGRTEVYNLYGQKVRKYLKGNPESDLRAHPFHASAYISTSSALWDRELIEEAGFFDEGLKNGQDTDMWARGLQVSKNVVKVPDVIVHYNVFQTRSTRRDYESANDLPFLALSDALKVIKYRHQPDFLKAGLLSKDGGFAPAYKRMTEMGMMPPIKPEDVDNGQIIRISLTPPTKPSINWNDGFEEVKVIEKLGRKNFRVLRTDGTETVIPFERIYGTFKGVMPERPDDLGKDVEAFTVETDKRFKYLGAGGTEKWYARRKTQTGVRKKTKKQWEQWRSSISKFHEDVEENYGNVISLDEINEYIDDKEQERRFVKVEKADPVVRDTVEKALGTFVPKEFMKRYNDKLLKDYSVKKAVSMKSDEPTVTDNKEVVKAKPVVKDEKVKTEVEEFDVESMPPSIKHIGMSWRMSKLPMNMAGKRFLHINARWGELCFEALRRRALQAVMVQLDMKERTARFNELKKSFDTDAGGITIWDRSLASAISSNRNVFIRKMDVVFITMQAIYPLQKIRVVKNPEKVPLWNWLGTVIADGGHLYVEEGSMYVGPNFRMPLAKYLGTIGYSYEGRAKSIDPVFNNRKYIVNVFRKEK